MIKEEYSLVVVFSPKTDKKEELVERVVSWIEETGAKLVKKEEMGSKNLAYLIKGFDKGDFWIFEVESDKPVKLTDLNLRFNRENNIIRYLVLKK